MRRYPRCIWDKRKNCKQPTNIYKVFPDKEICRICLGITKTQQDKPTNSPKKLWMLKI
jgi:hypothetical protein